MSITACIVPLEQPQVTCLVLEVGWLSARVQHSRLGLVCVVEHFLPWEARARLRPRAEAESVPELAEELLLLTAPLPSLLTVARPSTEDPR